MSRFPELAAIVALALALPAAVQTLSAETPGIGRAPLQEEIAAWDIDARVDGRGLPKGRGTVKQGEALYQERCASCHGEFGEGVARWPELAGGQGTLNADRPLKTVGSYWPHTSTVFDYVRRAMPFGNAQSLTVDETYAVVAYLLSLNDVVKDEAFELNERNLATIHLPNEAGFLDDDREKSEKAFWRPAVCMTNCKPPARIINRAATLQLTPDAKTAPKVE